MLYLFRVKRKKIANATKGFSLHDNSTEVANLQEKSSSVDHVLPQEIPRKKRFIKIKINSMIIYTDFI